MEHRSGALEGVSLGGGGDSPGFSEDLHPRRSSSLPGDVLQQHVQRQDFHPVNVAYNAHTHLPTPGTAGLYDNNPAAAAAAMMNVMNNMGNVHSQQQQQQQGGGFNTPPHATSRGRAAAAGTNAAAAGATRRPASGNGAAAAAAAAAAIMMTPPPASNEKNNTPHGGSAATTRRNTPGSGSARSSSANSASASAHAHAPPSCLTETGEVNVSILFEQTQQRWLKNQEVYEVLLNCRKLCLPITSDRLERPNGGTFFLVNRKEQRNFRRDGHNWQKKKDGKTVKETHEKLQVLNKDCLNCYYAHAEAPSQLRRRCYWLLEPPMITTQSGGDGDSPGAVTTATDDVVLVHYLAVHQQLPANPLADDAHEARGNRSIMSSESEEEDHLRDDIDDNDGGPRRCHPFTDEEDSKLRELVQTHGAKDWDGISLKMGVERDGKSCRQRWLNHLATGVNREPFSRDEDAKIIALQRELGNRWSKIAHALGSNRLDSAVRERWKVALNPAKQHKLAEDTTSPPAAGHPSLPPAVLVSGEVAAACPNLQHSKLDLRQQLGRDIDTSNVQLADCKGQRYVRWTDEEDSNLRELVQTHGAKDWDGISLKMGGERNAKGCRQRWLDHLDTGVNREPFSRDEDAKIIALQRELGNRWSKIAHALGSNRLDSAVRERWKVALNRAKQQKLAEDGRLENSAGLPVVAVAAAPAASPSSWTPLTGVKRRQPEDDTSNVADGQPAHYANQLMFVPFAWPLPSLPYMNTPTTGGVFTHGDRSVFNNEVATPHLGHGDAPPAYQGNAFQHYHNHHQHVTPLVVAIPPPATPMADKQTPHASAAKKE